MSINKGDSVFCIKDKKDVITPNSFTNGMPSLLMIFKKGSYYGVGSVEDGYIYISDGSGFLLTFYDGIENCDQKHPNFWDYFKSKKQVLNEKLKKVKNA